MCVCACGGSARVRPDLTAAAPAQIESNLVEDDPDVLCVVCDFGEGLDGENAVRDLMFAAIVSRGGAAACHAPEVTGP